MRFNTRRLASVFYTIYSKGEKPSRAREGKYKATLGSISAAISSLLFLPSRIAAGNHFDPGIRTQAISVEARAVLFKDGLDNPGHSSVLKWNAYETR